MRTTTSNAHHGRTARLPVWTRLAESHPPFDTCHLRSSVGKGCTYTSSRPDSLEEYAIHRPSGDIRPPFSSKRVVSSGFGVRSPSTGTAIRSNCAAVVAPVAMSSARPSFVQAGPPALRKPMTSYGPNGEYLERASDANPH